MHTARSFLTESPTNAPETGTRVVDCRNCGRAYSRSNLMKRWAIDGDGKTRYTDVHEAACFGWEVLKPNDSRHPFPEWKRRYR